MQPTPSRMTAVGLQRFMDRWELTGKGAAQSLGLSHRAVVYYLSGTRTIPQQTAILIKALDELWTLKCKSEK